MNSLPVCCKKKFRIAILGDDFTPAKLFERHLKNAFPCNQGKIEFALRDIASHNLQPYSSAEVEEAFGDPSYWKEFGDANVLVTTFAPVTREVINGLPSLLAIACGRGGPININVPAATAKNIPVVYARGRNTESVAEYTVGMMICLLRQVFVAAEFLRNGNWVSARQDSFEKPSGPEINNLRVGIIGFGEIGRKVAKLASAFGARVMVFSPHVDKNDIDKEFTCVSLETLLNEAEVITIHARIDSQDGPILGWTEFAQMKCKPIIINTSRPQVIDNDALKNALRTNQIASACLDVFTQEPVSLKDDLLEFDSSRLLLTPHVAGVSRSVPEITGRIVADGIGALLSYKTPRLVANPDCLAFCWDKLRKWEVSERI